MTRRKQNGKQSRGGIGMPLPQKMARYANLLVNDQSNTAIGGKLLSLIDEALDQEKGLLLRQAITAAPPEAAMLLENAIRVQASTLSHLQTVEVGELTTELFAVPVIFHFPDNPVDFAVDLGLDVTADTYVVDPIVSDPDWLIESLKDYGLGAEANGDVLHVSLPYLYSIQDLLSIPYVDIRHLCEAFEKPFLEYQGLAHRVADDIHSYTYPAPSPIRWQDGMIQARFIIGACIYPTDQGLIFERDELGGRVEDWRDMAEDSLSEALHGDPELRRPASLYAAIASAQQYMQRNEFETAVSEGLGHGNIDPQSVSTYMSYHFWVAKGQPHAQMRLAGYKDDDPEQRIFSYAWDMQSATNMDEAGDFMIGVLDKFGIKRCVMIEGILPQERRECCGEPKFRGPLNPSSDHRASIMSSGHMH